MKENTSFNNIDVAIDLGSSSLKIAFSYVDGKGKVHFGKLTDSQSTSEMGVPAIAFFDDKSGKWLFGSQVSNALAKDFSTVVGIKSMISLLSQKNDAKYYTDNKFPKFYLPGERKDINSFDDILEQERFFTNKSTPKQVCEEFFDYVADFVKKEIREFEKSESITFKNLRVSLVYPSHIGAVYIKELTRLAEKSFSTKVYKSLSAVKALGILASIRGLIGNGEKFLVFDIGEEYIAVAKTWVTDGQPYLDGADGHKGAEKIGGIDIDKAICDFVEEKIRDRETIFTDSAGKLGHVYEICTDSQKYRFLKEIKKAKHILSGNFSLDSVMLYIMRECIACKEITVAEVEKIIGVNDDDEISVANQLYEYIFSEAMQVKNNDVTKIILAGGVAGTLGLDRYLKRRLNAAVADSGADRARFEIVRFNGDHKEKWDSKQYLVSAEESSSYAPALGGAIVAAKEIDIKIMLTKSYGTVTAQRIELNGGRHEEKYVLSIFADKGSELKHLEPTRFVSSFRYPISYSEFSENLDDADSKDEIVSTNISEKDIQSRLHERVNSSDKKGFVYGKFPSKSISRQMVEVGNSMVDDTTGEEKNPVRKMFNELTEGKTEIYSSIHIFHNGKRVRIKLAKRPESGDSIEIGFYQGILVDPDGFANVIIEVCQKEENRCKNDFDVVVNYWDAKIKNWGRETATVPVKKLTLEYETRVKFSVGNNQD